MGPTAQPAVCPVPAYCAGRPQCVRVVCIPRVHVVTGGAQGRVLWGNAGARARAAGQQPLHHCVLPRPAGLACLPQACRGGFKGERGKVN